VMEVDAVIPSIGTSANPLLAQTTPDMTFNKKGYIVVESEKTGRTTKKGVFAGGDIVTGAATVILAAARAAPAGMAIDKYLKDGECGTRTPPKPEAPAPPPRSSVLVPPLAPQPRGEGRVRGREPEIESPPPARSRGRASPFPAPRSHARADPLGSSRAAIRKVVRHACEILRPVGPPRSCDLPPPTPATPAAPRAPAGLEHPPGVE